MSGPAAGAPGGGPVRPAVAVFFASATFLAFVIFGWGMLSLALEQDVIETPGLGPVPGITATTVSVVTFALCLTAVVRRQHPSYWNAAWIAVAAALAAVVGVTIAALLTGAPLGISTGLASRFATSWVGAVVVGAGLICAWGGIALVRTRAHRPRWPWEDPDD